jgi:hypothetical protein
VISDGNARANGHRSLPEEGQVAVVDQMDDGAIRLRHRNADVEEFVEIGVMIADRLFGSAVESVETLFDRASHFARTVSEYRNIRRHPLPPRT